MYGVKRAKSKKEKKVRASSELRHQAEWVSNPCVSGGD
jgi:hypothetical protein